MYDQALEILHGPIGAGKNTAAAVVGGKTPGSAGRQSPLKFPDAQVDIAWVAAKTGGFP